MVSNARLDLPEPERPVTTTRLSRGISSDTFLRLWTPAPLTATVVRGAACGAGGAAFPRFCFPATLEAILSLPQRKEGQLLHVDVASLREPDGNRRLADEPLVRQV